MKRTIDKKRVILFLWIGLAFLALRLFADLVSETETFFPARYLNNIWLIAYLTVLNFILFEYIGPYLRLTFKRILIGIFLLWAMLMLYSFGLYAWRYFGILLHIYTPLREAKSIEEGVEYHFPYSVASIVFFGIARHWYDYRKLKEAARQLKIEKQEAELNYLKSQTNPHFLFNTLNNIYSLARDKSDLAPESILRLSKILRFMLYETSGDYIAIGDEVKIISDYIALEQLRYDESLRLNFNYDIEDMKQALPPLLLIPLVENAFKHGVAETRERPFIDIHLSSKDRRLVFVVKNSTDSSADYERVTEKIGLSNLRRQLELLYTDYKLSVEQKEATFTASLNINLASHVNHKMHHS